MKDGKRVTSMLFAAPDLRDAEDSVIEEILGLQKQLRIYVAEPQRWTHSLRRAQAARHVQGSNSIEGFNATLDDAQAIELGEEPLDATMETRHAIAGYSSAMTFVLQLARDDVFEYSPMLLRSLHYMMTSYDLTARPGQWRVGSIFVQDERTGENVYEGPPLESVPGLIDELSASLRSTDGSALVRGAMAHLNLVMIHPFRDGNGRMARCLQTLVLAREGIVSPEFSSIEEYLGAETRAYYDILALTGKGSWHPGNDARPWIRFCLLAHLRQARTVLRRVRESERLWVDIERLVQGRGVPDRALPVLWDAAMGLRVRRSVYMAMVAEIGEGLNEQAASRDLRMLSETGFLVARGEKRGRFYVAGSDLRAIREAVRASRDPRDDRDPFADEQ